VLLLKGSIHTPQDILQMKSLPLFFQFDFFQKKVRQKTREKCGFRCAQNIKNMGSLRSKRNYHDS
jgi:hypothetical protein